MTEKNIKEQKNREKEFDEYFAQIWSQNKSRLKALSKKETAKYFFILAIQSITNTTKE